MDQRQTLDDLHGLKAILLNLCGQKSKASLLVDREGLIRMEGIMESVEEKASWEATVVMVNDSLSQTLFLREIIAVNGVFSSDYSEC